MALFVLAAFLLCSVIYSIFYIFHKTSLNAQPLLPPFFEELAAHLKHNMVSHLGVLRFFFYFLIFGFICWYPLPPPWARLVPFLVDVGAFVFDC